MKLPWSGRDSPESPGAVEEPETPLSVKLLALGFYFRRGLSTFCCFGSNLKVSRKKGVGLKETLLVLSSGSDPSRRFL